MPAVRTRQSAPPRSHRHTRHSSVNHRLGAAPLARPLEEDADDENEDRITSPHVLGNRSLQTSVLRKSHHRRTKSHTHTDFVERDFIHLTPVNKRKVALRPSLVGPRVQEMTVHERAHVVILIAQDCIVKLLSVGLGDPMAEQTLESEWRGAWDSLQAQRHQSLFVDHHLPFTDILDVTESLHKRLRGRIDSKSLEKANHLCNLATFIYIILDPDHAAGMLEHVSEGAGLDAIGRSGGSRKGKERERSVDQVQEHTRNRNRILIMAWKQFWSVVIPRSMRSSKPAMDLWLDFATQIYLTFTSDTIGDNSTQDLLEPGEEVIATLFAASAIVRRGQWIQAHGSDLPDAESLELDAVERKWAKMAARRRTELKETRDDVLARRYRWHDFRTGLLALIDGEILNTLINRSVSPRKPLLEDLQSVTTSETESVTASESNAETPTQFSPQVEIVMDRYLSTPRDEKPDTSGENQNDDHRDDNNRDINGDVGGGNNNRDDNNKGEGVQGGHDLIDFDQFQFVLADMQRETAGIGAEIENQEDRSRRRTTETPTQRRQKARPDGFRFGSRQPDAQRVPWESQDPSPSPSPKRPNQQPLFQPQDSASDTSVGPSETPRFIRARREPASQLVHGIVDHGMTPGRPPSASMALLPTVTPMQAGQLRSQYESEDDDLPGSSVLGSAAHTRTSARRQLSHEEDFMPASSVLGTPYRQSEGSHALAVPKAGEDDATPRQAPPLFTVPAETRLNSTPRNAERSEVHASVSSDPPPVQSPGPLPRVRPTDELFGMKDGSEAIKQSEQAVEAGMVVEVDYQATAVASITNEPQSAQPPSDTLSLGVMETGGDVTDGAVPTSVDGVEAPPAQETAGLTSSNSVQANANTVEPVLDHGVTAVDVHQDRITSNSPQQGPHRKTQSHRSQHAYVNHRQRRYEEPDFAGQDPDDNSSDDDGSIQDGQPPIRIASMTPVPRSPLAEISPNKMKQSPRIPRVPDEMDDFIVVPPFEPLPAELRFRSRLQKNAGADLNATDGVAEITDAWTTPEVHALSEPDDLYMVDDDGSPLEPDDEYTIPHKHEFPPSRLHGQTGDQTSTYSRKSGSRKWTQAEALLLYRTVQKVPLDQLYPLRVVWYLYGEHGIVSHDLEDFNPQHMKDKMKTIVTTRVNNRRPVIGRARFWLPPISRGEEHPDKAALKAEIEEADRRAKQGARGLLHKVDERRRRITGKRKSSSRSRKRTTRSGKRDVSAHFEDEEAGETDQSDEGHDDDELTPHRHSSLGQQEGEEEFSDIITPPARKRRKGRAARTDRGTARAVSKPSSGPPESGEDPDDIITPPPSRRRRGRPPKDGSTVKNVSKRKTPTASTSRSTQRNRPTASSSRTSAKATAAAWPKSVQAKSSRDLRAQQRAEASGSRTRPPPSRPQPFVDLPTMRQLTMTSEGSRPAPVGSRSPSLGSETEQDGNLVESLVAGRGQGDSGEETDYDNKLTGKQMRRTSAGERLLSPVYMTASSDEDGHDSAQENGPDAAAAQDQMEQEENATNGVDDDDDPNAKIAHELEIRQRVWGGYDDSLPSNLRRR